MAVGLIAGASAAAALPARAQYILTANNTTADPAVKVIKPTNTSSQNAGRTGASAATAYVDDVFLQSIRFATPGQNGGATTLSSAGGQFVAVGNARVTAGFANVNAEYGDFDTGSDGNPNPFVTAGIVPAGGTPTDAVRESTEASIQNPAIRAAFNSLSLVQGIDGEAASYTLNLIFQKGITDNLPLLGPGTTGDNIPELVFFERGRNSRYQVRAITGGTFDNPTFAPTTISINSGLTTQASATGIFIDTIEINTGQELGVTGLDLNSFFGGAVAQTVYGVQLIDIDGADLYGNFLSAASPSQLVDVPLELRGAGFFAGAAAVPESGTGGLIGFAAPALLGLAAVGRRRRRSAA